MFINFKRHIKIDLKHDTMFKHHTIGTHNSQKFKQYSTVTDKPCIYIVHSIIHSTQPPSST